jgi:predicted nucleic acid-binding Zn ribbon protein
VKKKAARVSELLEEVLSAQGLRSVVRMARLISSWPEIVGPLLSGKTSPVKLRARVLTVLVLNHAWAQELQLRKPDLLDRVRRVPGNEEVADIRFQVGPLPEAELDAREMSPGKEPAAPGAEPEGIAAIADPETREILRAVARKAASRKP